MRYSKAQEDEVKKLAKEGKDIYYIHAYTKIPKKVIQGWCPELRPHEDVIKWSVKQRFHYDFPEYEAVISSAFSQFVRPDITDKQWENLGKTISNVLLEEAINVFSNSISDPPEFTETNKVSDEPFLYYLKRFWSRENSYFDCRKVSDKYIKNSYDTIRYWSSLREKSLKDITTGDIEILESKLIDKGLSESRREFILRTGKLALKVAYQEGLTLNKAYAYVVKHPKTFAKPSICYQEAIELFTTDWESKESMLANFIAFVCGFSQVEVRALRMCDIGRDYITSENVFLRGNKIVPNKNKKVVKVSPTVINLVLGYVKTNPHLWLSKNDYIFYTNNRNVPADPRKWGVELKNQCDKLGYDSESIDFSVWKKLSR